MAAKTAGTDRRVQRTRRALRDALIALLAERGWDDLSVQDICDRADIGRSTFYTHFDDKEELLRAGFEDLRAVLRAGRAAGGDGPLGFARGLIAHVHDNQQLFRAIVGRRAGHFIEHRFRQLVIDVVRDSLAGLQLARPIAEATVHHVAGAFVQLLTWWIDGRAPLDPDELEALFVRLSAPALTAARGAA
jgi:AcrR family transcriptional regulator